MGNIVLLGRLNKYTPNGNYTTWWDEYGPLIIILSIAIGIVLVVLLGYFLWRIFNRAYEIRLILCYDGREEKFSVHRGDFFCPPFPERDEYRFSGWYLDANRTVPYTPTKVYREFAVYAKWEKL